MFGDPTPALSGDPRRQPRGKISGDFDLWRIPRHHQRPSGQRVEPGAGSALKNVPDDIVALCRIEDIIDPVTM